MKRKEDMMKLLEEFEETGGVTRICPECNEDCERTEVDAGSAYCSNCEKSVKVSYII